MLKLTLLPMVLLLGMPNGTVQAQATATPLVPSPGCHFGEVIDGTTADDAMRHMQAAGYTNIHSLKKSCDNYWHGRASMNGVEGNVLVKPDGTVRPEGD
jgi:hypothetical protein